VHLTEAGRIFADDARSILAHADHASRVAERISVGHIGQLTVGVTGPPSGKIFVDVLRAFGQRHPNARILLRQMAREQLIHALKERRIHVGFIGGPLEDPVLSTMFVMKRPLMMAMPSRHPMARRPYVRLADLVQERHVLFPRSDAPQFFDAIVAASRAVGLTLTVTHEADGLSSAFALVAAGLGMCLVPSGFADVNTRSVALRPIRPALRGVDAHLFAAYRSDDATSLVQSLLKVVEELAPRYR